jgi:hypothetical protein
VEASAVDDIVAETFAIAWRRLPARADPLPWLYGVARRVVHGHRRAHVRRAALTARLVSRHAATPPPDPAELIVDDPALAVAFATLTEREREAVRLVAWEGLSHARAAAAAGCSPGAFAVRLAPPAPPPLRRVTAVRHRRRIVLLRGDGRVVGEISLQGAVSLSWNAEDNVIDRSRNSGADDDPSSLLSRARDGEPGVSERPDASVDGRPVHVVALAAGRFGGDSAPERVYYLDARTLLPVRVRYGATVTQVLEAERLPRDDLSLSAHPGARMR